ncbi:MAG TPA: sulfotransferase [Rudaea sp.]|jgi:Tfp pilus assembly protein PilF|nr:sulfotransferase [Rudaea sp.]
MNTERQTPPSTLDFSSQELTQAVDALRAGDFRAAEIRLQALVSNGDERPETCRLLALAEFRCGNLDQAAIHAQRATVLDARDPLAWNVLGMIRDALGQWRIAADAFGHACRLRPDNLKLLANWGKTLVEHAQFAQAIPILLHALTLGEHSASRLRLATAFVATGQLDAAERLYREQVSKYPMDGSTWFALASLGEKSLTAADADALREHVGAASEEDGIGIQFALSRYAEQQGDYASAFAWLVEANTAERGRVAWDAAAYSRFVTDILDAFQAPHATAESQRGHGVLFILGLPRTGSTLVEQSIGQHDAVSAGGELSVLHDIIENESKIRGMAFPEWVAAAKPQDWTRLGEEYLAAVAEQRGGASVFTDKRCGNWIYIGAIARMLPGARIIYTRRDAVDTCFGCFRQRFSHGAQLFSYRLDECAAYLRDCERAMQVWQQRFPERIRVQEHELLLSRRDEEIAALGEFCGLPMRDVPTHFPKADIATASAAQLRSSRAKARSWSEQYGSHLDALRLALRAND